MIRVAKIYIFVIKVFILEITKIKPIEDMYFVFYFIFATYPNMNIIQNVEVLQSFRCGGLPPNNNSDDIALKSYSHLIHSNVNQNHSRTTIYSVVIFTKEKNYSDFIVTIRRYFSYKHITIVHAHLRVAY